MKTALLLILTVASFCRPAQTFAAANMHDSLILVDFYNATNGAHWGQKWNLNQPVSSWYGITLNASGRVTQIKLGGILISRELSQLILAILPA